MGAVETMADVTDAAVSSSSGMVRGNVRGLRQCLTRAFGRLVSFVFAQALERLPHRLCTSRGIHANQNLLVSSMHARASTSTRDAGGGLALNSCPHGSLQMHVWPVGSLWAVTPRRGRTKIPHSEEKADQY
jgi:hypothetical protein